ncbi:MAG: ABC transporter substrate-binding protein [Gammaproteobacteria bacterium]|nr:ABC transporter substrate-binding protein [Gammaproteobacteria bacterium]
MIRSLLAFVLLACSQATAFAEEPREIRLVLFGGIMATGIYVAEDTGLFAEENLQVTVKNTPNSIYLMTELVKGNYDIAQASIDNFFAYQAGQGAVPLDREPDLRVVMGGTTMKLDLVVSPDVNSYSDIKGEDLGVDALTTGWAFVLKEMLQRGGLNESDYEFVETGNTARRVEALKNGDYRATLLVGNYINQAYEAGFKRLDDSLDSLGPYQGSSFGLSAGWAAENPDTVIAFMRAYIKAMDIVYDANRREEVVDIVSKHTGMSPEIARKTLEQLTSGNYGFTPRAALDMDGVETVLSLRNKYGQPQADFSNLDDFVNLSYYHEAIQSISNPNSVSGSTGLIMIDKRGSRVRFFDPDTLEEISNLEIARPHELAISPDRKTAYVPIFGDGIYGDNPNPGQSIVIIDLDKRTIKGTIDVSPYLAPHGLQVDDSGMLYATAEMSRKLLVIDPAARSVEAAINTDGAGHWAIVLPNGEKAYVANKDDRKFISVIDLKARRMTGRVPMPNGTQGIAISPDNKRIIAIDYKEPRFYVIDVATDKIVETVEIADNSIGPFRARYSPSGDTLITINDEDSLANIYDGHDLSRPQHTLNVGEQPFGIAYSKDGSIALVSNHGDGTITVLDLDELRVVRTFPAGTGIETLTYY